MTAISRLETHVSRPPRAFGSMQWVIDTACPPDWVAQLVRFGGGFFHSPVGLAVSKPEGVPLFARLLLGGDVAGIALATEVTCRFGRVPRHAYLPTLPALICLGRRDEALTSLAETLRERGAAEVIIDSFDARWKPGPSLPAPGHEPRQEYLMSLDDADPAAVADGFDEHHRRAVRSGERAGWTMRSLSGRDAWALLWLVQLSAADRQATTGGGFPVTVPDAVLTTRPDPAAPWGLETFSAWDGPNMLAGALVGWAGDRAFYVMGGSTPDGYRVAASVWLQWRIMTLLIERGCRHYSLGGSPASTAAPDHPARALYRFKTGFGAEELPCRGARWEYGRAHLFTHDVARRMAGLLHAGAPA